MGVGGEGHRREAFLELPWLAFLCCCLVSESPAVLAGLPLRHWAHCKVALLLVLRMLRSALRQQWPHRAACLNKCASLCLGPLVANSLAHKWRCSLLPFLSLPQMSTITVPARTVLWFPPTMPWLLKCGLFLPLVYVAVCSNYSALQKKKKPSLLIIPIFPWLHIFHIYETPFLSYALCNLIKKWMHCIIEGLSLSSTEYARWGI